MPRAFLFFLSVLFYNAFASSISSMPSTWLEFESAYDKSFDKLFHRFMKEFGKEYNSAVEEYRRLNLFSEKVSEIFNWNSEENNPYQKGITRFTDMFPEERKSFVMPEKIVEHV
jgi:hypothetical protein